MPILKLLSYVAFVVRVLLTLEDMKQNGCSKMNIRTFASHVLKRQLRTKGGLF